MEKIVIAILICLPTLALSAAVGQCQYGEKKFNPGETVTFDEHCSQRACTCDKDGSGTVMCNRKLNGCLDGSSSNCYKVGQSAMIQEPRGLRLQCVCRQRPDGKSFAFADCHSETCKDSRTGAEKKKGESVTTTKNGVTYVCTCAGVDGYKACRTEESISRDNKCLDDASGKYVPTGAAVTTKQGNKVLHCTCSGTNHYAQCRSETCTDDDGSEKKAGEKVTTRYRNNMLSCICAGVDGYKDCRTEESISRDNKCLDDVSGKYVPIGATATTKQGNKVLHCTCSGTKKYTDCRPETCTDDDGSEKKAGERVTSRYNGELYSCICAGVDGYNECQSLELEAVDNE